MLDSALKKNPKDTAALIQRAELEISSSKYQQAESDLNQAMRMQPTSAEVHYVLAKLHQIRGENLTYRQELSEALRLKPGLLKVRLELAQALIASNSAKSALDVLDESPGATKKSQPVLVERNWALWASGDTKEMRKGIDEASLQGKSTDLLLQDGLWRLKANDFKGARATLEQALQMDGTDLRALSAMVTTLHCAKTGANGFRDGEALRG